MAIYHYITENVYSHTFTPREYQVELIQRALNQNTIVCSSTSAAKAFISLKLAQELSWQMRKPSGKRAFYILDKQNLKLLSDHFCMLTDLSVGILEKSVLKPQWLSLRQTHSVFLMTAETCLELLSILDCDLSFLNLLVIDDCLYGERQRIIENIMKIYDRTILKPRIIGLVSGLLGEDLKPSYLESELLRLESLLRSRVDTSSEIVTLIKLSLRPKELILECKRSLSYTIEETIKQFVMTYYRFLEEHRYDPFEIYSEEYMDELKSIPDPRKVPMEIVDEYLHILDELGVWCAHQASFHVLKMIEKLKVKTPYERHYLLLCGLSTNFFGVRHMCEKHLEQFDAKEVISACSTDKVKRFLEVLREMGPPESDKPAETEASVPVQPEPQSRGRRPYKGQRRFYCPRPQNEDSLCALVFVDNACTAKVMQALLNGMKQVDPKLWWVGVLYTLGRTADPVTEAREAEAEHRKQEEVLRKFRAHECNILISTPSLEHGFDLPRCNLIVRLDVPKTFHSYVQSKARARTPNSYYVSLVYDDDSTNYMKRYSEFLEVERVLLRRCRSLEPTDVEMAVADAVCDKIAAYKTNEGESVSLTSAIQLINRYCAKLPSDTFTKLVPNYDFVESNGLIRCNLRLPINSPIKLTISSPAMRNEILAKRYAAFNMCQLLHKSNELDDSLNPITKENFRATEDDWNDFALEKEDQELSAENVEQRPGTTKRRQYYYKRIAAALQKCLPKAGGATYFYKIVMTLTCPIPEEQNTRGRKIYPPEESIQGFGILTEILIPEICAFPIFTRSGEVNVSLELCKTDIRLTEDQLHIISEFLNYTFTSVLRLQKYQMLFNPKQAECSYFIVPTIEDSGGGTSIDWDFLRLIYDNCDVLPKSIPDEQRLNYVFEPQRYDDAVVMPWYRNQDQPQYFYVAEICGYLSPASAFPGSEYATFQEYYLRKYGITIQNKEQHLLDVDHTSARLNFLTPRYVNRKGVALPTSSEETKRAKRENLEQKQILVPELCAIHPFPASLWRKAVCLPCILYRVNALLLADQIRRTVAIEIHLGKIELLTEFKWPPLNFGWSLSDVLKKSKALAAAREETAETNKFISDIVGEIIEKVYTKVADDKDAEEEVIEIIEREDDKDWLEIGTWSNDLVETNDESTSLVRYGSPTSWVNSTYGYNEYDDYSDSDSYYSSEDEDEEDECGGLRIEFQGDYIAEAVDQVQEVSNQDLYLTKAWDNDAYLSERLEEEFAFACKKNIERMKKDIILPSGTPFKKIISDFPVKDIAIPINELQIHDFKCDQAHKRSPAILGNDHIELVNGFSFDKQPDLVEHPGPSPSVLLQALTMSNANDGINLERLETIGDSFLKYAITDYLYSKYENTHEGKLSHLRSKQVSNLNLYRLGKRKLLGDMMIATKFDPHDNWLPPCYSVSRELEEALSRARIPMNNVTLADYVATRNMTLEERCLKIQAQGGVVDDIICTIPYNLVTQHSIPDKSIADCVEALIGAYLIECGPRGALLFMAWLGIRVLPKLNDKTYGSLEIPASPLLYHISNPCERLTILLDGYDKFENILDYRFNDRAYLLQAMTHASYSPNNITDCYQRLEFLGDAVLDYLITRHLYEDQRMHSPGALTDLRSALVNNTIFASLAVKFDFHKYFLYLSPGLHLVIENFIRLQKEGGRRVSEELFLLDIEEGEEFEDVEVPKVLGDVFESVAGAIFLDSGRSLDAVWKVYHQMMQPEIEQFSDKVPKSPIRELLELEPETAKFGAAEKLADGRRVRVSVEVFGKGVFKGIGRNYRIAKCTAAKCALKHLKKQIVNSRMIS